MSEPGDELTPLPEQPEDPGSRWPRSPYLALGAALVVVSTVFATVASLAASPEEQAAPAPENRGSVETTYETDTSYPTTTTSMPSTSSSAPTTTTSTTTTTTTTTKGEDEPPPDDDQPPNPPPPPPGPGPTTKTSTPPPPPANKAPTAMIGGGCPETGTTCSFTGSGSSDPEGGALRYSWNFGDGSTSTSADPSHTFEPGSYTVTLTVTDNKGLTDSTSMPVTVTAATATSSN